MSDERLLRARLGLEGLSVGDAFGEGFFSASARIPYRVEPSGHIWEYTDDTNMALSIYWTLRSYGRIEQDALAQNFAARFEPRRGYGSGARRLMMAIQSGAHWREVASVLFGGEGSYGNGSAMRIAPLAGYFADDLAKCAEQARLSSEVTHAHPEGVAGGIAAAVAGAVAWQARQRTERPTRKAFIEAVLPHVPNSEVKDRLVTASNLTTEHTLTASGVLGNGMLISCQDTVPICLWLAGEYLGDYSEALWQTISIYGDIDTNAAIVGGIVALYTGMEGIPAEWRAKRERLPAWAVAELA